jgi:hypothetical protein
MKRHSVVLGYMFLGLILAAPAICAESMSMYFRQFRPQRGYNSYENKKTKKL